MNDLHIISAVFPEGVRTIQTDAVYQYNYGQFLSFSGLELPESFEVHFSNDSTLGKSKALLGDPSGVNIPDEYFKSGDSVYCFIVLHDETTDGETVYKIIVPVVRRPEPTDEQPDSRQQSIIDQLISRLPEIPTTAGLYNLQVTVSDGKVMAEWVAV